MIAKLMGNTVGLRFPAFIFCEGERFIKAEHEKKLNNKKKRFNNILKSKSIRFTL